MTVPLFEQAGPDWQRRLESLELAWKQTEGRSLRLGQLHPKRIAFMEARRAGQIASLRERAANDPADPEPLVELADEFVAVGHVDRAIETLQEAVERGWTPPSAPEGVAKTPADAYQALLLLLLNGRLEDESAVQAWRKRAAVFLEFRNRNDVFHRHLVLAALNAEIERDPDDEPLRIARAKVYGTLRQYEDALAEITAVVERAGKSDDERFRLIASVAKSFGDIEREAALYSEMILKEPGNQQWRRLRASALAMLQRYSEAIGDYAILSADPRDGNDRMKYLLLQLMLGMSKTYSIGCRKLVDEPAE
jgi:tetratricopeptide (TPR) repeat protein